MCLAQIAFQFYLYPYVDSIYRVPLTFDTPAQQQYGVSRNLSALILQVSNII